MEDSTCLSSDLPDLSEAHISLLSLEFLKDVFYSNKRTFRNTIDYKDQRNKITTFRNHLDSIIK
jgi:hypothetical protein